MGINRIYCNETKIVAAPPVFAYCLARSTDFREFAIQNMTGTSGRQRVPAASISNYQLPFPIGFDVPKVFGEFINPFFSLASRGTKEATALATLRDTLLPKLISGTLRVDDVEEISETI